MFRTVLTLVWLAVAGVALNAGWAYYQMPLDERLYAESHALFAPTGLIGQGYGIIGTLMIAVGVILYMVRKRVGLFAEWGKLKAWLEFHIFLCTLGPFLVLLHTTFKFGGLVSIAFWSMTAVVASGVFGRYVYVWIPKTVNGHFLTDTALAEEQEQMLAVVRESALDPATLERLTTGLAVPRAKGLVDALSRSISYRVGRRRRSRNTLDALEQGGLPGSAAHTIGDLLDRRRRLAEQAALLHPFQRMFRYWHAFHLPLAGVMVLILVVHVGVTVWLGYTWIF